MNCLQDFIKKLEKNNDLIRIKFEVSTVFEMTEISKRFLEKGSKAILFENVITENGKSSIPVLTNLFGTVERVASSIGYTPDTLRKLGETLAFLRNPTPPDSIKSAINMLPLMKSLLAMKPKIVSKARCQEVVYQGDEVDLSMLPIQTCWPLEPSPLITWPMVITQGHTKKNDDSYNLGIYRMQVTGKNTTIMRWLKHRGGAQQHDKWKKFNKEDMPVAVAIGCDPATMISAVTPIPETVSEYQFAGLLRKKKLELVNCKTIPLQVPANAEIILEGYVSNSKEMPEGPYGDHTGYYNSIENFPEFRITAITTRKNPVYLSTYTGKPPDEPSILGEALNEVFIPILIQQFPEIVDFYLPPEACSYRVAIVAIRKSYPGHASKIMMGVWSFLRQFMYSKFIIVVDDDIDIRSWEEVMWAISTRVDPERDSTIIKNTPIDYLDFASPKIRLGSKMGIDATNKIYPETDREWGRKIEMDPDIVKMVNDKLKNIKF